MMPFEIQNIKKGIVLVSCCVLLLFNAAAQPNAQKVFTEDIDHFWTAYDSCRTTTDSLKQLHFVQTLYVDKGTEGLLAFMKARDYSAPLWVSLIRNYPRFWNSIRPATNTVKSKAGDIETSIQKFKRLYPQLRPAKMYFTIGGFRSGGTTMNDLVLVGTEIAAAGPSTDVSEFPEKWKWLTDVFRSQRLDNIVSLNVHEYVHTQQRGEAVNLLGDCIMEGACDFVTELVMGRLLQNNYIVYGRAHETELKAQFKTEMFSPASGNWLYNASSAATVADLGYFMGYTICKQYYKIAVNKQQALREIIELDYSDTAAVEAFLRKSQYFKEPLYKTQLVQAYEAKRPMVTGTAPFVNGDTLVDPAVKEIHILFSAPMDKRRYSVTPGEKGKETWPVTGITGFSADGTAFTLQLDLRPGREYEIRVSERNFASAEGFFLKPYTVKFRTRAAQR
ncbi:hypothetical protein LL912_12065 [Niabella sp. CC-SYL272]|uniref:hypothetical protein n=1 Tax=Niabella agricola TaxID=2891571 RepID=UPI001F388191|nr:hypothetical protein [Niabella agricola]MCF3109508.1 hypothetical protein [Niabella agricola]